MPDGTTPSPPSRAIEYVLVGAVLCVLGALVVNRWYGGQVARCVDGGAVERVSSAGGLTANLLIETELAYYPMYDLVTVEKGTRLVLQERRNGDRYLCDARLQECGRVAGVTLKNSPPKSAR